MAGKKQTRFERIAQPVEEYWEVPFVMIGDTQWYANSFEAGALNKVECINIDTDREAVDRVIRYLQSQPAVGIDTETMGADKRSGLDPWRDDSKLLLFQIGTANSTWIVQPEYTHLFKGILEDPNIIHILQNAVFDYKYLKAKYLIEIENIFDTMLGEQILTAGRSGLRVSLAELCRRYRPYRLISKDQRDEFINFQDRGYKFSWKMLYYAARDINLLFPIREQQLTLLTKYKLNQTSDIEFKLIPCTAMMELGGTYINQKTLGYAISYWKSEQDRLEKAIIALYEEEQKGKKKKNLTLIEGIGTKVDVGSTTQKKAILEAFGYAVDNIQRETLKEIDHEVARMLAEYSGVTKITSTYGDNLLKRINPVNGRLHPEFNQLGLGDAAGNKGGKDSIATGRYSSDFQQLPKPNPHFAVVSDSDLIKRLTKKRELNNGTQTQECI